MPRYLGSETAVLALTCAMTTMQPRLIKEVEKANLGVRGLDDITVGGLTRGRLFLLEGSPGTGKTTIATQFLMAGAAADEPALYITLSETEDELRAGAASHGWSLEGVDIFELVPPESLLDRRTAAKPALFLGP